MTLTNRLLVFFLSIMAIVLIGFSSGLYFLADNYLRQQTKERVAMVLNTIGGAIENGSDGVEWEPTEREQSLQFSAFVDPVVWIVTDNHENIIAESNSSSTNEFCERIVPLLQDGAAGNESRTRVIGSWQVAQKWVHANDGPVQTSPADSTDDGVRYQALCIAAGVSRLPMRATLQRLAYALVGLSGAIWFMAFVAGRSVCRRALLPVRRMAVAANEFKAEDMNQRLPSLGSHDELDELTRAYNHMLERLQEAFERQRRFTGDASHQLRTPLTAILGQVEVALRRDRSGAEYKQVLETVQDRTTHLVRMVESLLFLARADAESQHPALEPLDLSAWLPRHLQTWSEHPRFGDISTEAITEEPLTVAAQSGLLAELLDIVLDNACKYSEPGTPITIRAGRDEGAVWLKVEDRGFGLDDLQLAKPFEPFLRSSEARRRGIDGVGLGLSIAKRLAEVFEGEMTVVSQTHKGSCFTIRFPLARLGSCHANGSFAEGEQPSHSSQTVGQQRADPEIITSSSPQQN